MNHFRPISLCNVIYKVISKILVNKLKPIIDSIITPYQNDFIKDRNISNNILLAHEIIDVLRKKNERKFSFWVLKINMSKAYDKVSWNFLKVVLTVMNFDTKWIKWIVECVLDSVHFVNFGNLTNSFKPSQGLRQWDPLSTYIFLMCANILIIEKSFLKRSQRLKKYEETPLGSGCPRITSYTSAPSGLYLLCIHPEASEILLEEMHEGIYESHTRGRSLSYRAIT